MIWNIPLGLHIVSYLFASCDGPLSPLFMAWANILCSKDKQVRALTLAFMNACGNAVTLIIQQFLYETTDAPEYRKGFPASLAFVCGMAVWVFVVRWFELRTLREKEMVGEDGRSEVGVEAEVGSGKEAVNVSVAKDGWEL